MGYKLRLKSRSNGTFSADIGIEVEAARKGGLLSLRYTVTGDINFLIIPSLDPPQRRDGLWQHTCFEAFIRPAGGERYYEFNLAPSNAWAAYRFDSYREGMMAAEVPAPRIEVMKASGQLVLEATVDLSALGAASLPWQVGLSAVIEHKDGSKSYWALAHPHGKPDFHHQDCFALRIDAPAGP